MEAGWIGAVVKEAIERYGSPNILNSDQGGQFTSEEYINLLTSYNIQISMDGKGRVTDNVFVERLWRSLKYQYVYRNPAGDGMALYQGLSEWFRFYNYERHHQTLDYRKLAQLYRQAA